MGEVIPIRKPIDEAALELYHRYKGRYWFHSVKVVRGIINVYHKKNKPFREWLGNDDTYKSFKYAFIEDDHTDTRLKN